MPYPLWPGSPDKAGLVALVGQRCTRVPQPLKTIFESSSWIQSPGTQRWPENKVRKHRTPTSCKESTLSFKKGREGLGKLWELSQVSRSRPSQTKTKSVETYRQKRIRALSNSLWNSTHQQPPVPQNEVRRIMCQWMSPMEHLCGSCQVRRHGDHNICFQ